MFKDHSANVSAASALSVLRRNALTAATFRFTVDGESDGAVAIRLSPFLIASAVKVSCAVMVPVNCVRSFL